MYGLDEEAATSLLEIGCVNLIVAHEEEKITFERIVDTGGKMEEAFSKVGSPPENWLCNRGGLSEMLAFRRY